MVNQTEIEKMEIKGNKKNIIYFSALVLLFLFSFKIVSENLQNCRKSSFYTLIYKISNEEAAKLYKDLNFNSADKILRQPIDSFPTDSTYKKKLFNGHYVNVCARNEEIVFKIYTISNINAYIIEEKKSINVFVYDKQNLHLIENLTVKNGSQTAKFNADYKCYTLNRLKNGDILSIKTGMEEVFFEIEKKDNEFNLKENFFSKIWKRNKDSEELEKMEFKKPGYIVLNKPIYLPKDTVKLKALVLDKKGKYFNGPIVLKLSRGFENKNKILAKLYPINPGNYVYQFAVGDSLKLNNNYTIQVWDPKTNRELTPSNSFELKDYQLDETTYSIRTEKKTYHENEDINLYVSGKDANGLSILDGKVKIKLLVNWINKFNSDHVFIPNQLWEKSVLLDPIGETRINIPHNFIPEADLNLKIDAIFNNSNNETHEENLNIEYNQKHEEIKAYIDSGFVKAEYLINEKSLSKKGNLKIDFGNSNNDEVEDEEIVYPYRKKLDAEASQYEFSVKNKTEEIKEFLFNDYYQSPKLFISTLRTKDSVKIRSINSDSILITYQLIKGNQIISKGLSTNINIGLLDRSDEGYSIEYNYAWMGESIKKKKEINLQKNELKISLELPVKIFPGEKTRANIEVTDTYGNAAPNSNITAFATNSQFKESNCPNVYWMLNELNDNKETKGSYVASQLGKTITTDLSNIFWVQRLKIDTLAFYKMLIPKNGLHLNYDPIPTINPQVSPHLVQNGKLVAVFLVYMDDQLIYYYKADNTNPYSFIGSPGYHTLRIRSINAEYTIDSVFLKKSNKLDFAIDIDHFPKQIRKVTKPNNFDQEERNILRTSLLVVRKDNDRKAYIWQGNNMFEFKNNQFGNTVLCGFIPDSITYAEQDNFTQNFYFEPNYYYEINKGFISMKCTEPIQQKLNKLERKCKINHMGETALNLNTILLKSPDFWCKQLLKKKSNRTNKGNGEFNFNYSGDSAIALISLKKIDKDGETYYCNPNSNNFNGLQAGFYSISFYTAFRWYFQQDSIFINEDGVLHINFKDLPKEKIDLENTKTIDLNELKNWETPKEKELMPTADYEGSIGEEGLSMTIIDGNTNEPLPFTNVTIFKNKKLIKNLTTNIDGKIKTKSLYPGKYEIMLNCIGYKNKKINNVIIRPGIKKNLIVNLKGGDILLKAIVLSSRGKGAMPSSSDKILTFTNYRLLRPEEKSSPPSDLNIFVRGNRSDSVIQNSGKLQIASGRKTLRGNFSDYAYWQPNLITDENGKVSFEVTFPDNLTKWNNYILAANENKQAGQILKQTKAYNNIGANLVTPRFLVVGDTSLIIGKTLNYTNKALKAQTTFSINQKKIGLWQKVVKNASIDSSIVFPTNTDSLRVSYLIHAENGEMDGEEKIIPVIQKGIEESNGIFNILKSDTSFNIPIEEGLHTITIQNNPVDFLLEEINQLKNYPYWCMEQSASKLNACLMEKNIKDRLNQSCNNKREIRHILAKLEKGRNRNGSWGWWENTVENTWMTAYIVRIVNKAINAGYSFTGINTSINFLTWNLPTLKGNELLFVLNTLSECKAKIAYSTYLTKIERDSLSEYQKLMVLKIKQENKLPYSTSFIVKSMKKSLLGNCYWGKEQTDWYENSINNTLLAYQIIRKKDSTDKNLLLIRNFLLELKLKKQWHNTIAIASILETILPDLINNKSQGKIELTGMVNETITSYPYTKTVAIASNSDLKVTKSGNEPLYFTIYQKKWNSNPAKNESDFSISSHFENNSRKIDTLVAGEPIEEVINVWVKKKSDYVMLNIPIPAGCSYNNEKTNTNYFETHRESFKEKTLIFCESLPEGRYQFRIGLQPRFQGNYTLNPAKVEAMYFPVFYGRNTLKQVCIGYKK